MSGFLGEAGVPHDDESYGGELSDSIFSMDYYREKAREFQETLNRLDQTAELAYEAASSNISESLSLDLLVMLDEYESRKWTLKATAETINAGAAVVNAMGGRFPVLSVPSGLGAVPALPLAAIAAVATAATLISWGVSWIEGVNDRLKIETLTAAVNDPETSPETRDRLLTIYGETEKLAAASSGTGLATIATIAKWGAIAGLVFMGYKLIENRKG
jgi:hypothetical protein